MHLSIIVIFTEIKNGINPACYKYSTVTVQFSIDDIPF